MGDVSESVEAFDADVRQDVWAYYYVNPQGLDELPSWLPEIARGR